MPGYQGLCPLCVESGPHPKVTLRITTDPFGGDEKFGTSDKVWQSILDVVTGMTTEQERYSMKLLLAGVLTLTGTAFAADLAPVSYHAGTLVSFPLQASSCPSTTEQICSDDYQGEYIVKSEGILYALTPAGTESGSLADRVMLAWNKATSRYDTLYHQQPGTPVLLRDDGRHLFVKVGSRESKYIAIEAR
jgi:hypothetical protein